MKLISSVAFAMFVATAEGFGPATPVFGGKTLANGNNGMTMRLSVSDKRRRQQLKQKLEVVGATQTKESLQENLLTDETSTLISKSNWKLRKTMIRKVKNAAGKLDVDVDAAFGVPLTFDEQTKADMEAGVARRDERVKAYAAAVEEAKASKQAKDSKKASKKEMNLAKEAANKQAKADAIAASEKAAPAQVEPAAEPDVPKAAAAEPEAPKAEEPAAPEPTSSGGTPVTPKTIKQLRDATGAGMMDCKKALLETDGDQDAAAEFLRMKGLAKADKKASRVAAEGKIAFATSGDKAVMVEVNCETDFVGKDSSFLDFCDKVAGTALTMEDARTVDALMDTSVDGETLEATRQAMVAKIGENIQVRRMEARGGEGSTVGCYVHMNRIGVLVELDGGSEELCMDVAMHVAAMNPPYATADDVPADVLESEKKILAEQALESGKPPEIVEKMVEGRIRKYLEEICLVSQTYVKDGEKTVGKYLEENGAKMVGFSRIAVGEGIEKKADDFATEVAQMAGKKAPGPEPASAKEEEPVPEPVMAAPAPAPAASNAVTPKTIKQLRDATGAGMMDCKKALLENDGDQEAATEYLRTKGLAKADKKAARIAAEGKIAVANSGNRAVMVEVNCETDFVGKDASFLGFCDKVAGAAMDVDGDEVDRLMAQEVDGETLESTRQAMVAKIGENIQVRRMASRGGEGSTVGCYVHMNRIGVLVELEGGNEGLCTDVAMHIAAMNPPFATADDVPQDVLEKEKKVLSEQALESGKPPEIVEKMVGGRIRKYLEEICCDSQTYVKDGDKTVGEYLKANGAKLVGFTRIAVGEGIEKKVDNFAEEVAQMAGAN